MTLQSKEDQTGKQPPATSQDTIVSKSREQFKKVCTSLWEQEVRGALIYQKSISLCRGCLGLFYAGPDSSDHPQDLTVSIIKVCRDRNISRPECFETYLVQQSSDLMPSLGYYPLPAMSPSHRTLPKNALPGKDALELHQLNVRLNKLSDQITTIAQERDILDSENKVLKEEISYLIFKLLDERKSRESIHMRAQIKISELTGLFSQHEVDCKAH